MVGPGNRARVHRAALGGAAWKALHIEGLITWHLRSSDGGSLALQPLTGMTFMLIPREQVFLLLRAQQSALTCSFSPTGCRILRFQSGFSPGGCKCHLLAEHRAPPSVGDPGLLFLIVHQAGSRQHTRLSPWPCRNCPARCEKRSFLPIPQEKHGPSAGGPVTPPPMSWCPWAGCRELNIAGEAPSRDLEPSEKWEALPQSPHDLAV